MAGVHPNSLKGDSEEIHESVTSYHQAIFERYFVDGRKIVLHPQLSLLQQTVLFLVASGVFVSVAIPFLYCQILSNI